MESLFCFLFSVCPCCNIDTCVDDEEIHEEPQSKIDFGYTNFELSDLSMNTFIQNKEFYMMNLNELKHFELKDLKIYLDTGKELKTLIDTPNTSDTEKVILEKLFSKWIYLSSQVYSNFENTLISLSVKSISENNESSNFVSRREKLRDRRNFTSNTQKPSQKKMNFPSVPKGELRYNSNSGDSSSPEDCEHEPFLTS